NSPFVATSTAGSVTSNEAGHWDSVTAEAENRIFLEDAGYDITTKSLTAHTGYVTINAQGGKVYAQGPITAGTNVEITATDESSDAIFIDENVNAGSDILLKNNTFVAHSKKLTAGSDVTVNRGKKLSSNGNLEVEAVTGNVIFGGEVVTRGSLTVDAGTDITAHGNVTASTGGLGDLVMTADSDDNGDGDLTAHGELTTYGGDIILSASDNTIYLNENVNADVADDGDIWLNNNTVVAHGKKLTAGSDVTVNRGKKLSGSGNLAVEAITGNVIFGG
ncbi:unnamed protein product, partial [marine sediment metagenome]